MAVAVPAPAQQAPQPPAPASSDASTVGFARNWTRASFWHYFEPPPGGGDNVYGDVANRLQFGVKRVTMKYEIVGALQYVQFGGLPMHATGPGPFGDGALYFDHSRESDSHQVYLRYLNLRLKDLAPGLNVQIGRMAYSSGTEAVSNVPKIEAVKRQRLDARLIGEFDWSLYQRGFDGARLDYRRSGWQTTAGAFRPTQGGFEEAAGVTIDDIGVFVGAVTLQRGAARRGAEWQIFAYRYDDRRNVRARPDNTGRSAAAADVHVNSFGTSLVAAGTHASGEIDLLLWAVGQTGAWYEQSDRAYAFAAEAGHQWTRARWRPWLRGGIQQASGDADATDRRHETFFQMLPTGRKYALSATYSLMNLSDLFGQVLLRPRPALNVRIDVHRLDLANAADLWYSGSGAAQESGAAFGYAGRPSGGKTSLGTVNEGSIDYTFGPHWSVNGYVGVIWGGDVVRGTFRGDRLTFAYIENVLQF